MLHLERLCKQVFNLILSQHLNATTITVNVDAVLIDADDTDVVHMQYR